ncbi:MAG: insulinase family protein [Bacteroidetes bacterium]|nr:insulinase family protein [Bacteroidota bacterium]
MIDRTIAPEVKQISEIELIPAQKVVLENGLAVYTINAGSQELVKMEWIFDAGSKFETQKLAARTANTLLKEGTKNLSSAQIAEQLDYYGSFLDTDCTKDKAHLTVYSLNKHLSNVLPVVEDILKNATFPEHEFEVYKQNSKQKLIVNNQKVDVLARNHFNALLFGENHPYGQITEAKDYDALKLNTVKAFYQNYYTSKNCSIVVSGLIQDETLQLLHKHFGTDWKSHEPVKPAATLVSSSAKKENLIEKADAVQSAIRIGRVLFNKTHPDYFGMQVLNTVLGGYFGSRLMNNIREDKGYTYGIGSGIASLQEGGYFFIATEVGVDVCKEAVKEIFVEIKKLREELIPEEELDLVKNYLLGTFVRSIDGPFALSEKFISILEYQLDYSFYTAYLNAIRTITPAELRTLAANYLKEEDLIELVVGKK